MAVSLSIKNVPEPLAARLRERAARNQRSLQRELLCILEAASGTEPATAPPAQPSAPVRPMLTIEEVAERARARSPQGSESSVAWVREMRDSR